MTRINLVDPSELCDQHLLAEQRELTRIPNVVYRRFVIAPNQLPRILEDYTVRLDNAPQMGKSHVTFFYNKMAWLQALVIENSKKDAYLSASGSLSKVLDLT